MELRKILKEIGLIILMVILVWLAGISRWLIINRVPTTLDILLYLIGLPLLLLFTYIAVNKTARFVKERLISKSEPPLSSSPSEPEEDPTLSWTLPFVALDFILPQGESADELIAACKENKRPTPHESLQDNQHSPAFIAAIKPIDIQNIEESLPSEAKSWPDSYKRNLLITEKLVIRLLDKHLDKLRLQPVTDATAIQTPLLQIDWLLPHHWDTSHCAAAEVWLAQQLSSHSWGFPEIQLRSRAISVKSNTLLEVDELNLAYHKETLLLPRLLLVSDSSVDEETISAWDSKHMLYRPNTPEGLVPGEGAAGLLVVPKFYKVPTQSTVLGGLFSGKRSKDVSLPQRLQADILVNLANKAIASTEEQDWKLISDTDLRPSRTGEALNFASTFLPEQDPLDSLYSLGTANGAANTVLPLAALAVAQHECENEGLAALVFCHHDALLRHVMKVTPLPPIQKNTPALTA